jgi:ElaB/YqjD/DUF883 family membrane-anchored ribosome-binding protein
MQNPQDLNRTINQTQDGADALAQKARSAVDRFTDRASAWRDQAGDLAQQGTAWAQDSGERARREVVRASDRAVDYVRQDPMRAAWMAVAAGAVIYALTRWLGSSNARR